MTEESNSVSPVLKADWFDSRWGKEDQRGNGNLMTREKVLEAAKRRCHVIETTTRSGIAVRNFKWPRRPRATCSSPRRVGRGVFELM